MSRSQRDPVPPHTHDGFDLTGLTLGLSSDEPKSLLEGLSFSLEPNRKSQTETVPPTLTVGETKQAKPPTTARIPKKAGPNPLDSIKLPEDKPSPSTEADLGKEINSKYDQLNLLWTKAEENLRQFLVPYEVKHCYNSFLDESNLTHIEYGLETHECIGWARIGTQWRICVAAYNDSPPENEEFGPYIPWKPITESAIWYRQNMVKQFPKLKEKVIEAAKENLRQIEEAIADLGAMLN